MPTPKARSRKLGVDAASHAVPWTLSDALTFAAGQTGAGDRPSKNVKQDFTFNRA